MKTLIHNYSTPKCTEPMYFGKSLELAGERIHVWSDPSISAFDMFDSFQPEVFITHYRLLTNDILKYIASSNKKINIVFNVTGASEDEIKILEEIQENNKLDIPFVFSNVPDSITYPKSRKIKTVNIMPSADIFLPKSETIDYSIDSAIVGLDMNDLVKESCKGHDTYHMLCLGEDPQKEFDSQITLQDLISIAGKYKHIVLAGGVELLLSQALFETTLHANKTTMKTDDQSQHILDKFLASLFHDEGEDKDFGKIVKGQIKRKHTCINRSARLCKFLKNSEAQSKLEKVKDQIQ